MNPAVRDTEQRANSLQAAFDAAPAIIWIAHDRDCRSITGNRAAYEFSRVSPGQDLSKSGPAPERLAHFRVFHDGVELAPGDMPIQKVAASGRELSNYEIQFVFDDGEVRYLLGNVRPVFDAAGRSSGAVAAFADITERKRAEESLRELTQRLTYHVDHSPLAVIEWGPDMRLIRWSGAAERLFGWRAEEVLGKRMQDFRWIYDEDREEVAVVQSELTTGQDTHRFSLNRNYRKDGSVVWCEWYNSSLIDESGKLRSILSLVLDVTARKQAEDALRAQWQLLETVVNYIPASVCVIRGADLRLQLTNPAYRSLAPGKEMVGKTLDELWPETGRDFSALCRRVLETGEPYHVVDELNTIRRSPEGPLESAYFSWSLHRVRLPGDEGWGILNTAWETTQRKRAEQELARANEQLSDANRRKDEFLAMLAHELRNPLAPIRTGVHILRMKGSEPEAQPVLPMIERQLEQLTRLLDDLLDVSRITLGKIALTREPTDLGQVVQAAVEASRPLIESMGHRLSITLPAEPVVVDADRVRLAQVFSNLLNNAAKYTERGGHIQLSAEQRGEATTIRVKDDGMGLPPDQLERIFDLFSQVENASSRSHGGLGIGLALVKGLVALHGGTVEARSAGPGRGSEFVVTLPTMARRATAALEAEEAEPRMDLRILVVDDNRDAAESLALLLGFFGNEVRTAHSGEEALSIAAEQRPQAVLLDLGMPHMDGYEICRRLRASDAGRSARIIAVSGWGQEEDRRKSGAAGFDAHLVKPVHPAAITRLLRELCV